MIDGDELERKCRERARKVRRHAGFFDWPDKEIKELGVIQDLVKAVGGDLAALTIRPGRPDPPDAVGEREDRSLVAIEVTELIDQEVADRNIPLMKKSVGKDPLERMKEIVHRVWDKAGLLATIKERLLTKDGSTLQGGPFRDYVVVLHTDEAVLTHFDAREWLREHTFTGMRQVRD